MFLKLPVMYSDSMATISNVYNGGLTLGDKKGGVIFTFLDDAVRTS